MENEEERKPRHQLIAELLMKAENCLSRKEAIGLIHQATNLMDKCTTRGVYTGREGWSNPV